MFGTNIVEGKKGLADGFTIHSMFYTIQGEGPWAVLPAVFVRLSGCNLRCRFCDTDFAGGTQYTLEQFTAVVQEYCNSVGCSRIVFTGGEPMLYRLDLAIEILGRSNRIQIETAGTVWPGHLHDLLESPEELGIYPVMLVCSPKTPKVHSQVAFFAHAWKYIIQVGSVSSLDGLPVGSVQAGTNAPNLLIYRPEHLIHTSSIYVQPCDMGPDDHQGNAANIAEAVALAMRFGYRLSIQLHKIVGLP